MTSNRRKSPKPHRISILDAAREPDYRIWVNEDRTTLVTLWNSGTVEVATRETPDHTWGPPTYCKEERS